MVLKIQDILAVSTTSNKPQIHHLLKHPRTFYALSFPMLFHPLSIFFSLFFSIHLLIRDLSRKMANVYFACNFQFATSSPKALTADSWKIPEQMNSGAGGRGGRAVPPSPAFLRGLHTEGNKLLLEWKAPERQNPPESTQGPATRGAAAIGVRPEQNHLRLLQLRACCIK